MTPRPDMLLSLQSDERLVRLARDGNEHAFTVIVERYRRELHVLAGRMRSSGRADDLVQQTFLSAFTALRTGTEVQHLRGWLYRILRNEVIRTSKRSIVEVELDPATVASEPLEEASQRRMLAFEALSSIAALPDRQRDVLVASAINGESRAAVAGSMGLSEGAVRQLMHRARATLRAAAAAITPAPLANWMSAFRDAPATSQTPDMAIGMGTGSAAGVALKLGAILASGAIATGVVSSQLRALSKHQPVAPVHSTRLTDGAHRAAAVAASSGEGTRPRGLEAGTARVTTHGADGVSVGALLPRVGSQGGSAGRADEDHRGTSGGERHEGGSRGGGPGPSHASGGDGSSTGEDGHAGSQRSGVGDGSSGSGGSATGSRAGSDGDGSRVSGSGRSTASGTDGGGGSGETVSSGGSGSGGSGGGGGGTDSSGDVPSTESLSGEVGTSGSGGRGSSGSSSSSGDSGGGRTGTRGSSGF